ncbi:hypothetical protein [Allokutzneria albata]|uniref:DUF6199 domain-containing protein n=1 Tax=Allokutzneria albata TaxID=211114 RepID=A0A1G9VK19_ALLAB|nr:hypothetical protein [Allokutzneria albata]SDM72519.1 hypothetical protein SAMN04489726_3084 [Allokutzneria albata]
MIALAVVLALLGVGLLVLASLNPRRVWRRTAAWQFSNPDAVEPSDTAFGCGRVFQVVAGIGMIGFAGFIASVGFAKNSDILPRVQKAAAELSTKDGGLLWEQTGLDTAVNRALGDNSDLDQRLSGARAFQETTVVRYNVTLEKGKQAVCLVVRQGKLLFSSPYAGNVYQPEASAKPGACTPES